MMQLEQRLLRAALRDGAPLPDLTAGDWQRLPELARQHGLSPRVSSLLPGMTAPIGVRNEIRRDTMMASATQLQISADLHRFLPLMESTGVPWAAVKGPVLADHWYDRPGQRSFDDLDLVVHPAGFSRVVDILVGGGAELVDRNWTLALSQRRGELSLRLPHGTALDLHWHILNTPEQRAQMPLAIADVLGRVLRVQLGGLSVPTFDAVDTLLHLCLHTTLSGGHRLSWYRDLEQVICASTLDWDVLVRRTAEARAGLPVAIALRRARALTGAPVPEDVEERVAPRGLTWLALVRVLDAARAPGHPIDRRLSGRLLLESSRSDTRTSFAALGRSVARDLIGPVLHDPSHPWRRRGRQARPRPVGNPLWADPVDAGDRDRYMSFVHSQV